MTTALEPRSQTLDVNGLRVHYLDWGNPGAPPIVCVHGYTSSAQAFNALARRMVETLPNGGLVVVPGVGHAPDARGARGGRGPRALPGARPACGPEKTSI